MPCAGTDHTATSRVELGVIRWRTAVAGAAGGGHPGAVAVTAVVKAAGGAVVEATLVAAGDAASLSRAEVAGTPAGAAGATLAGAAVTTSAAAAAVAGALPAELRLPPSFLTSTSAARCGLADG